MSIPGRSSTAAILVRTGFVVVLVLVNVSGFRLVLARGLHGAGPSAWEQARHSMLTIMFAGREHSALSVSDPRVPPLILRAGTRRARSVWNDPSLVSYRHLVGYYRSPGTLAFCRLIPSTEVVGCCGQRWWSASRRRRRHARGLQPYRGAKVKLAGGRDPPPLSKETWTATTSVWLATSQVACDVLFSVPSPGPASSDSGPPP